MLIQNGLDIARLRSIIQRETLRHLSDVEEDPHNTIAGMMLYAFLYGDRDGTSEEAQLKDRVQNTISRLEALPCGDESQEAKDYWTNLVKETLLDRRKARVVLGTPSPALARQMEEEEQRRIEEQVCYVSSREGIMMRLGRR